MRRTRIFLVVIGLLLTAPPAVQAQHRGVLDAPCGCQACGPTGYCQEGCPPIIPPCITRGIKDALGGLFCCPGLNARHDIYRAALNRNDFGKCSKYVPVYASPTCCCGSRIPACPQCGPGVADGEEEVIDMQDVPEGTLGEPTPAIEPETPPTPAEAVPPQATRIRVPGRAAAQRAARPVAAPQTTRTSTPRDRVARATVGDQERAPVGQAAARQTGRGTSLIERAMLLQTGSSQPLNNSLRK